MEGLLTSNIFFVYLLGILVIINYEVFEKKQKIAIIYACSFGLTFNNDLRCVVIIFVFLLTLFLYEEYLNEDLVKIKYVTKIKHKIIDFLYMYVFQYKLLYIIGAIALKSNVCREFFARVLINHESIQSWIGNVLIIIAVMMLIMGVHKMLNNPVELKNFKQINQKFSEYPYYKLPLKDAKVRDELFKKLEMVADIEDYTFFKRDKSYSFFSLEFIKIIISKRRGRGKKEGTQKRCCISFIRDNIREILTWKTISAFLRKKHKGIIITQYVRKIFIRIRDRIKNKLGNAKQKLKRYIRGYSTIEMQLIRILAYKKGLKMGMPKTFHDIYLVVTRKLYEIVYAPIFFSGHKKYLNVSKGGDYYRYYLVYIYLHTVQTNLNDRVYAPLDKIFGNVDVAEWPKEALFIIVLGLNSMRITKKRVDIYKDIINKYELDIDLVYQLVDCIK